MAIQGRPNVLFLDATANLRGWEHLSARTMFDSMKRRGISLVGDGPRLLEKLDELPSTICGDQYINCIFLQVNGEDIGGWARDCWLALQRSTILKNRLFALSICDGFDQYLSEEILNYKGDCSISVCPVNQLTKRQSAAFFVKFFIELDLHCSQSISPMMARFAFAKAKRFALGHVAINL